MIISVIGAGGKTTVCLCLGKALARARQRVLLTTTTHIYPPEGIHLSIGALPAAPPDCFLSAAAREIGPDGKLKGFLGPQIDALAQKNIFDFILVEADGAKHRPLKAPAKWEPVYPEATDIVIGVIGLDSLGRPLNEQNVHRSAIFSRLTGALPGEPVTIGHLIALIRHPDGLFTRAPEKAVKLVLFNKSEIAAHPDQDAQTASALSGFPVVTASKKRPWADAFIKDFIITEERNLI